MVRPPGASSSVHASPLAAALRFAFAFLLIAAPASAKTFVLPHIIEASGSTTTTQFTFDTSMFITYGDRPGSTGQGATADLYLYNDSGQPMQSQTAADVCNPCSYALGGASPRKLSIRIDDLLVAAGGFSGIKLGYGVIVVGGQDPEGVAVQGFVVNSHTGPFDVSVAPLAPSVMGPGGGGGGGILKTYVVPHVFETAGRTSTTQYTFDTSMFMTYTPGLAGTPPGAGATADLYLLDDSGAFLNGGGGSAVCAPCSFAMSDVARKHTVSLESLIEAAGGFGGAQELSGYAVLAVSGDAENVGTTGFVVNSHTSAFDISVFTFQPQEITAPGRVAVGPGAIQPGRVSLAVSPNPVQTPGDGVALSFDLAEDAAVELSIHDVHGREIVKLARGTYTAGAHRMHWNARDAAGAAVGPGVYFARLSDPSGLVASRIVAIR